MPYWLPVRSRALHRRRFTTGLLQPFGQLLQIPRHRAESTDLEFWFLIRRSPHQTSRYALLVIEAALQRPLICLVVAEQICLALHSLYFEVCCVRLVPLIEHGSDFVDLIV